MYLLRRVLVVAAAPLIALTSQGARAQENTNETTQDSAVGADSGFGETPRPRRNGSPAEDDAIQETTVETKVKTKRSEKKEFDRNQQSGTGYGIYGGADLSLVFTSPSNELYKLLEASQLGAAPTAKIMGTIFTRRIALDLGLGMQYAFYSGERIGIVGDDLIPVPIKEKYSSTQLTMLIDAAARLKFKQKFQVGILATALYNNKSAGFTALPLAEDPFPESYLVFLGPQFIYETPFRKYMSRIGASFSVSLTGANRTSFLGTLHAAIGSHLNSTSTIIKTQKETRIKTRTVKEVISLKAETAEFSDNVSFVFDSQMVNFKLNSAELSPKSTEFLAELGQVFMNEREIWNNLIIEGHSDSRGSAAYNQRLSLLRAKSVAAEFQKAGVPASDLTTLGLGSQRPIVKNEKSEVDYARNRRVEIKVNGLKDARKLKKSVEEIQRKFFGGRAPTPPAPEPTLDSTPTPETTPPPEPVFDPGIVPPELE
jgi:outer membrane protein OmpA-like peptidoglycan-associated protein